MGKRFRKLNGVWGTLAAATIAVAAPAFVQAQVPPLVEAELVKMGRVVDPGCTGKLYRPLFGKNDYNTYWPVDKDAPNKSVKLYPGVTVLRDVSYGPQPKDLIDVFVPEKGPANRTVFVYIPGGAGNKIEQQSVEANMFYDNVGVWAVENGMIGVTMQRGGTAGGQNIALVVEWVQKNAATYKGNAADIFLLAHSAGTGPLTQYIGRPDLYGVGAKGAIFMGGHPQIGIGPRGGNAVATNTAACSANANVQAGAIRGPSSTLPDQGAGAAAERMRLAGSSPWRWDGKMWISTGAAAPAPAASAAGGPGGGRGGPPGGGPGGAPGGGGRGGPGPGGGARGGPGGGAPPAAGAAPAAPAFTTLDGFKSTRTNIALAWGEIDVDATSGDGMPTQSKAIHDELCKLEGPKAQDGVGHCPTMMWFKGESHVSEVFSFGSSDKIVSDQVIAFIKKYR